jgi:hypothetical protein
MAGGGGTESCREAEDRGSPADSVSSAFASTPAKVSHRREETENRMLGRQGIEAALQIPCPQHLLLPLPR